MPGLKDYIRYSSGARKAFYKMLKFLDKLPFYKSVYENSIKKKAAGLRDFPGELSIETINLCNARCTICAHPEMKRPKGKMPDAMVRDIIDQAAYYKAGKLFLSGFGEPLLDNRLAEFIAYAKSREIRNISIVTNGYLLSKEKGQELIDSGLNEIIISIDGFTPETYEQIRVGLNFDRLVENLCDLASLKNRENVQIDISCVDLIHNRNEKAKAYEIFGAYVDSIYFRQAQGWTRGYGKELSSYTPHFKPNRIPCRYLWDSASVYIDGTVPTCCLDYEAEGKMGNINNMSLDAIWRGKEYSRYRQAHLEGRKVDLSPCNKCGYYSVWW